MTRHPAARRIHQHESSDDALTAKLLQLFVWGKRNLRVLVTAAVVLVVGTLSTIYSLNVREAKRVEAMMRLGEVRMTVLSGNHALALRDLENLIARFGGTSAADEARLLMAQVALETGEAPKAIEVLQPLTRKIDSHLGGPAALLLASAYEQSGNHTEAEATYLRIADQATPSYQRRDALAHAARIKEEQGDHAGAATLYQRLIAETDEGTVERSLAELRLAEARAKTGR